MLVEISSKVCGHTYTKDITKFGGGEYVKEAAARKKATWWEDKACFECWRVNKQAELAKFDTDDLPTLEGSEKQVNWANKLRPQLLKKVNDTIELMFGSMDDTTADIAQQMRKATNQKVELLKRIKEAKFWIEVREYSGDDVLGCVDLKLESVTTVWYTQPRVVLARSGRQRMVGGTKPHYREYALA